MDSNVRAPAPVRLPSDQDATGRSFDRAELDRLRSVLDSGVLTSTRGTQTPEYERRAAELTGRAFAVACSSGTAAVHAAVAVVDPEPGDEIVTTAITDMGAVTPILYQGAIPVFADVDSDSGMVTAESVRAAVSERTRAIIVTHLFGIPAEVDAITAVAHELDIPVIEDCAQAFLARRRGRRVGTFGAIGCYSSQQGKHFTTGEGGLVVADDEAIARRARVFVNKGWPYGEDSPDHEFIALNYRTTELQSAVANAQLDRLESGVGVRQRNAARLAAALQDVPGVEIVPVAADDEATWWKVPFLIDPSIVPGGPRALAARLADLGIASAPRYIQKPAFECRVIRDQQTFGSSRWPFTLARPDAVSYPRDRFAGTYSFLERVLVLPWNERYEDVHVDAVAEALQRAVADCVGAA